MKVLRLETVSGQGVFSAGGVYEYDAYKHKRSKFPYEMPTPLTEKVGTPIHNFFTKNNSRDSSFIFGFSSKTQLKKYFGSKRGRVAMGKFGIVLSVYDADRSGVYRGEAQVAFDRNAARKVGELDIVTLELKQNDK